MDKENRKKNYLMKNGKRVDCPGYLFVPENEEGTIEMTI